VRQQQRFHTTLVEQLEHLVKPGGGVAVGRQALGQALERLLLASVLVGVDERRCAIEYLGGRGPLDVDLEVTDQSPAELGLKLALDAGAQLGRACDQEPVESAAPEAFEQG